MEKFIITAFIVCIIISTVLLLFVIVSVSKNKTKQWKTENKKSL